MRTIMSIVFVLIIGFTIGVNGDEPEVPCHFIFGDSLSDPGNNNKLVTTARADYSPYGIDFPGGVPTGRFTNGRNIVDFITEYMGFSSFIPPYSSQMGEEILRGVNYASGAAGILEETGSQLGGRISMDRQLRNYKNTISQLQSRVEGPVSEYLNKCLFTVNIGSNDYINNYLMPQFFNSSKEYTPEQYANFLIGRYRDQLLTIHKSGARKMAIFGLGHIGCTPAVKATHKSSGCVKDVNEAVKHFNTKLVSLVDDFNANLATSKFTFISLSSMQNLTPFAPGFLPGSVCCKKLRSDFMCEENSPVCMFRDLNQYMDGFHPTEFTNRVAAHFAYDTPFSVLSSVVHPMSIRRLIRTKLETS